MVRPATCPSCRSCRARGRRRPPSWGCGPPWLWDTLTQNIATTLFVTGQIANSAVCVRWKVLMCPISGLQTILFCHYCILAKPIPLPFHYPGGCKQANGGVQGHLEVVTGRLPVGDWWPQYMVHASSPPCHPHSSSIKFPFTPTPYLIMSTANGPLTTAQGVTRVDQLGLNTRKDL